MRFVEMVLLLGLAIHPGQLFGGCTVNCSPPTAWQKRGMEFTDVQSTPQAFRFVGFGTGLADKPVVCLPNDPNPHYDAAVSRWQDFRFYGLIPGVGIARGTLNLRRQSFISLTANGSNGLFPAKFLNHLFIRLDVPGRHLAYENEIPLEMQAGEVVSAPPPVTVVSHQVKTQDVLMATSSVPKTPKQIVIIKAEQKFLALDGLKLEKLESQGPVLRFRVSNLLAKNVQVAYFLHLDGVGPSTLRSPDGVVELRTGGARELSFRLPSARNNYVGALYAAVLAPVDLEGAARIPFEIAGHR